MKVKILEASSGELKRAIIKEGNKRKLPSIQDGWIFNLRKHSKATNARAYILVHEDTPETIEGCMIFSIHETFGPFMNFLEVAPHNRGKQGKYKHVARCLIAYACGLSFERGVAEDKGILTFQAAGKSKKSVEELEELYKQKYGANKNPFGYMEIYQDQSKRLIKEYLDRN